MPIIIYIPTVCSCIIPCQRSRPKCLDYLSLWLWSYLWLEWLLGKTVILKERELTAVNYLNTSCTICIDAKFTLFLFLQDTLVLIDQTECVEERNCCWNSAADQSEPSALAACMQSCSIYTQHCPALHILLTLSGSTLCLRNATKTSESFRCI